MDVLSSQGIESHVVTYRGLSCCQFSFMEYHVDVEIGLYCKVADQTVSILTDIKTISRQLWWVIHAINISTSEILLRKREGKGHQTPWASCACHQGLFIPQHSFCILKTFMVKNKNRNDPFNIRLKTNEANQAS